MFVICKKKCYQLLLCHNCHVLVQSFCFKKVYDFTSIVTDQVRPPLYFITGEGFLGHTIVLCIIVLVSGEHHSFPFYV